MTRLSDIWTYRSDGKLGVEPGRDLDLTGFHVEALDGGIGSVDEGSPDLDPRYLVVDTGPWIFGKKVMLPAGVIDRIDLEERTVHVHRTKEEIRNAPEFDEDAYATDDYRLTLGMYYDRGGPGWRPGW